MKVSYRISQRVKVRVRVKVISSWIDAPYFIETVKIDEEKEEDTDDIENEKYKIEDWVQRVYVVKELKS